MADALDAVEDARALIEQAGAGSGRDGCRRVSAASEEAVEEIARLQAALSDIQRIATAMANRIDAETGLGRCATPATVTGSARGERINPEGVTFSHFGVPHDFPADAEVSLDTVREAVRELLTGGGKRPTCVT